MDDEKMALATTVYNNLCSTLDKRDWKYSAFPEDLVISFKVGGEDIPMDFVIHVDADRQLLRVTSPLPFKVPEEKRMDLAIAACVASFGLADGSFDFDMAEGIIGFRLTVTFRNGKIGEELFDYIIGCSCSTVDRYNDRMFALSKGMFSIDEFIKLD